MAFSVKVDVKHRDDGQAKLRQVDAAQSSAGRSDAANAAGDSISFSAGNPRVEHITGVVHLYRDVPAADQGQQPAWTQPVRCHSMALHGPAMWPVFGGTLVLTMHAHQFIQPIHSTCRSNTEICWQCWRCRRTWGLLTSAPGPVATCHLFGSCASCGATTAATLASCCCASMLRRRQQLFIRNTTTSR